MIKLHGGGCGCSVKRPYIYTRVQSIIVGVGVVGVVVVIVVAASAAATEGGGGDPRGRDGN